MNGTVRPRVDETKSWCGRVGRDELERLARPVPGVVVDVDVEHALEVSSAEDQDPVETFTPDGADETLGVRVLSLKGDSFARSARIGVRITSIPSLRKIATGSTTANLGTRPIARLTHPVGRQGAVR